MTLFIVQSLPPTNALGVFDLKEALKARNWVVTASSDGTTYNASSDIITSGAAGAGGFDNASAWFGIRSPDAIVFLTIQHGGAGALNNYRIKMGRAPFNAGSPTATVTPNTTDPNDEVVALGSGSDAAPAFQALIGAAGTTRVKTAVDDTTGEFYMVGLPDGGGNANTALVLTRFEEGDSDTFPYMLYTTNLNHFLTATIQAGGCRSFLPEGGGLPLTAQPMIYRTASSNIIPVATVADPITGKFPVAQMPICRPGAVAAGVCWKGFARLIKWVGVAGHATGDTYTLNSTRDLLIMRDCCLPWDGSALVNGVASTDRDASELAPMDLGYNRVTLGSSSAAKYLMQANDSVTGGLYRWPSNTRDFAGVGYPGPNSPVVSTIAISAIKEG